MNKLEINVQHRENEVSRVTELFDNQLVCFSLKIDFSIVVDYLFSKKSCEIYN